jgi:hypothetical protein
MYLEKILNTAYSFAAAIVVFGAWAKLEHQDFGGLALTIGLLVESGIFIIYGFAEWGKQPDSSEPSAPPPQIDDSKRQWKKQMTCLKKSSGPRLLPAL